MKYLVVVRVALLVVVEMVQRKKVTLKTFNTVAFHFMGFVVMMMLLLVLDSPCGLGILTSFE